MTNAKQAQEGSLRDWIVRHAADIETVVLIAVYVLGTVILAHLGWLWGVGYVVLIVVANVLFAAWICPYCHHAQHNACHSNYHLIVNFFNFKPKEGRTFAEQYKRNLWVQYPVWGVPPLVALGLLIFRGFSWRLLALLVAFSVCGFLILPAISRQLCGSCGNTDCPRRPS